MEQDANVNKKLITEKGMHEFRKTKLSKINRQERYLVYTLNRR